MAAPPAEYSFEWRGPAPPPPAKNAANFSPPLIAMVAVIGTAFLIVLYARILSRRLRKFRRRWRRWRRRRRLLRSTTAVSSGAGSFASSSSPEHFFSPYGLDDSAINTLPLSSFPKSTASRDCAVCLFEFDGGDSLRSLPICSHSFHVDCIDVWLRSHATCPLCRAVVFPFNSSPFVPMRAARIRPSIDDLLLLDPPRIESEIAPPGDPAAESNVRRDFLLKRSYSFGFERNLAAEASPWRCRNRSLWSKRWPSPFGGGGSSSAPRSTRFLSFRSYVKSPFQRRRGFFIPLSGEPGVRLGGIGPSSRRSRSMTSPSAIFFASSRMRCGDPEALLSPERLNRR